MTTIRENVAILKGSIESVPHVAGSSAAEGGTPEALGDLLVLAATK